MKNKKMFVLGFSLAVVVALAAGCGSGSGTVNTPPPPPPEVKISAVTGPAVVERGVVSKNYVLSATVTNPNGSDTKVNWTSSDSTIVAVSSTGVMTPTADGTGTETATITATADADSSKASTFSVTVTDGAWVQVHSSGAIETINADGSGLNQLIETFCSFPSPTQDGLKFACLNQNSNGDVTVIDVYKTDGTATGTKVATSIDLSTETIPLGTVDLPTLSPDGTEIAFLGIPAGGTQTLSLYLIASDGTSAPVKLYQEPSNTTFAGISFRPDGKKIAFFENSSQSMWQVGIDGSNPGPLVNKPSIAAFWSIDMKTVYWTADEGDTYMMDLATGASTDITPGKSMGIGGVSPSGKYLVLTAADGVHIENTDGTNLSGAITPGNWTAW